MATHAPTHPATTRRETFTDCDGDTLRVVPVSEDTLAMRSRDSNDGESATVHLDRPQALQLYHYLADWLVDTAQDHTEAQDVTPEDLDAWSADRGEQIGTVQGIPVVQVPSQCAELQRDEPLGEWDRELLDLDYQLPDAEPETITAEAERQVYGDRHQDYGHPREDFTRTATIWTGLLAHKLQPGAVISPEDMARCMIGVKLARDVHRPKRDNRVDGAGYFLTLDRLETGR